MNAVVAVFLPLLLAYATALHWCWDLWTIDDGYFAHGPLVPMVMLGVVWARRQQWSRQPAGFDARGAWLLLPALLLHLGGAALTIDSLSAASLVLAVPGAALLALGRQRLRGQWPVLWLWAFAVPLPIYVTGRIAFELKEVAVRGGVWLAQASGLDVAREGAFLHVPGQETPLDVADPCGGLRSLLAMVTLVYCVAFFLGPATATRRTLLLIAAAPVAVFVNLLRIGAICWAAHFYGTGFATGAGHDWLNAAAWIVDLAVVLGFDALLSRSAGAATMARPAPVLPSAVPAPVGRAWGIGLWVAAVVLLALSLYRPRVEDTQRAQALPTVIGRFAKEREFAMSERFYQLLGTNDAAWRGYTDGDGDTLFVVAVFHGTNWKSVHPPRICLEASDMVVVEDGTAPLAEAGGTETIGRILCRGRSNGRPYLTLYAYGSRDLCTGSYSEFFLHHAPRAIFRASNDGFLMRVDAYADGEGGLVGAEARCRELLRNLVDRARELLP